MKQTNEAARKVGENILQALTRIVDCESEEYDSLNDYINDQQFLDVEYAVRRDGKYKGVTVTFRKEDYLWSLVGNALIGKDADVGVLLSVPEPIWREVDEWGRDDFILAMENI